MGNTKVMIGGGLEEDAAVFLDAWHRAECGEHVEENVLAFEAWETLAATMAEKRCARASYNTCKKT